MPSRIAARLVTGPTAFLLGGVLDLGAFALRSLRAWVSRRVRSGSPQVS